MTTVPGGAINVNIDLLGKKVKISKIFDECIIEIEKWIERLISNRKNLRKYILDSRSSINENIQRIKSNINNADEYYYQQVIDQLNEVLRYIDNVSQKFNFQFTDATSKDKKKTYIGNYTGTGEYYWPLNLQDLANIIIICCYKKKINFTLNATKLSTIACKQFTWKNGRINKLEVQLSRARKYFEDGKMPEYDQTFLDKVTEIINSYKPEVKKTSEC